jgi:hypothetical protein
LSSGYSCAARDGSRRGRRRAALSAQYRGSRHPSSAERQRERDGAGAGFRRASAYRGSGAISAPFGQAIVPASESTETSIDRHRCESQSPAAGRDLPRRQPIQAEPITLLVDLVGVETGKPRLELRDRRPNRRLIFAFRHEDKLEIEVDRRCSVDRLEEGLDPRVPPPLLGAETHPFWGTGRTTRSRHLEQRSSSSRPRARGTRTALRAWMASDWSAACC